jgi:hypothetical protein
LLKAILKNHKSHAEASKSAKTAEANLKHKIEELEGERAVMAGSSLLAFERSTLRESDSSNGAKNLHLAFAGKGGGRTGVRAANATHPTLPTHERITCRSLAPAWNKRPTYHEGGGAKTKVGVSG